MKTAFLMILLLMIGSSCVTNNSKSQVIEDINEELFNSLRKEILDTLIGRDLLIDIPNSPGIFGASSYIKYDSAYFDRYLQKTDGFKWTGIEIVQKKEIDRLFEGNSEEGFKEFRNRYGQRCFVQISVPFFSPDQKEVFFAIDRHCSEFGGYGMHYHYKKVNGEWKLITSKETWVS